MKQNLKQIINELKKLEEQFTSYAKKINEMRLELQKTQDESK